MGKAVAISCLINGVCVVSLRLNQKHQQLIAILNQINYVKIYILFLMQQSAAQRRKAIRRVVPPGVTPYTADDYNADGSLKRLKPVPLGNYPAAVKTVLDAHSSSDFAPPPPPIAPPKANITDQAQPPVQNARIAAEDPPEFRHAAHHIAIVSYVENRHPLEDQIVDHYVRQELARRDGTYDPIEDPPVDLRQIIPTLTLKVTRTFTKQEAEFNDGAAVREYITRLHSATDWNILPLECGKGQPLPVSDYIAGVYKNAALQQQMDAFYKQRKQGGESVLSRIDADAADGGKQWAVRTGQPK
jgi:hypothetical protein